MAEIVILGWTELEPGDREIWLGHARELVDATRREPGVQRFSVVADPDSDTGVLVQEHYIDEAAFDAHRASAHLARFLRQTAECRVRLYDVAYFDATARSGPPQDESAS